MRVDGGLTVAKSVKFNVVDPTKDMKDFLPPAVAEGLPEELLLYPEPPTRKELRDEVEFRARLLNEEENFDLDKVVEIYKVLEALGDTDMRIRGKSPFSSWYTGAFVHGGVAGIRSNLKEFPQTTRYLTGVAKKYCGGVKVLSLGDSQECPTWTTSGLSQLQALEELRDATTILRRWISVGSKHRRWEIFRERKRRYRMARLCMGKPTR